MQVYANACPQTCARSNFSCNLQCFLHISNTDFDPQKSANHRAPPHPPMATAEKTSQRFQRFPSSPCPPPAFTYPVLSLYCWVDVHFILGLCWSILGLCWCQSCSCWCSCCASGCSCFCSRCLRGCCAVEVVDVVGAVLCGASRNMLVCSVCCCVARTVSA